MHHLISLHDYQEQDIKLKFPSVMKFSQLTASEDDSSSNMGPVRHLDSLAHRLSCDIKNVEILGFSLALDNSFKLSVRLCKTKPTTGFSEVTWRVDQSETASVSITFPNAYIFQHQTEIVFRHHTFAAESPFYFAARCWTELGVCF